MNTRMDKYYKENTLEMSRTDRNQNIYNRVNEALRYVSGAQIVGHEISGDMRCVTYSNGVKIYINYGDEPQTMNGVTVPAMSYGMEGK